MAVLQLFFALGFEIRSLVFDTFNFKLFAAAQTSSHSLKYQYQYKYFSFKYKYKYQVLQHCLTPSFYDRSTPLQLYFFLPLQSCQQ